MFLSSSASFVDLNKNIFLRYLQYRKMDTTATHNPAIPHTTAAMGTSTRDPVNGVFSLRKNKRKIEAFTEQKFYCIH